MTHYVGAFMGANLKAEPHLLDASIGSYAMNCRFENGALDSFRLPLFAGSDFVGVKSLFLFAGTHWLQWNTDTDVVEGPVPGDTEARTYFTRAGVQPQYTFAGLATQGLRPWPGASLNLGVPAPPGTVTATVTGEPADPEDIEETRFYVMTWVSSKGEEGPPTPISNMVTLRPGQGVSLTNLPTVPSGNYQITSKNIYRTSTAAGSTEFQLVVAGLATATTIYQDNVPTESLGGVLESIEWDPPPTGLHGLVSLPGGILAGFVGKDIYFSEPYRPHAWPRSYRLTMDYPCVGLSPFPGGLIALTSGTPYVVSATHPAAAGLEKVDKPLACVSKRGIVDMGNWAVYPTSHGLVAIGPGQPPVNITEPLLTEEQWRELAPETIIGFRWRDHYIGFYDGVEGVTSGGFVISPKGDHFTFLNIYATAGYANPRNGKLYLVMSGNVNEWDAHPSVRMVYAWRSKVFLDPGDGSMSAARVDAESYPLLVSIHADGAELQETSIANRFPFRIKPSRAGRWQVGLEGTARVRSLSIGDTAMSAI